MPDETQIRRKILLRALGSPLVVGPFLLGMTALTASWALGFRLGFGVFAALAGLLTAGGAFVTRLLFRGETLARRVTDELTQGEQRSAQKSLDTLDQHLALADDDPRPETALRDLRALVRAFDEFVDRTDSLNAPAVIEVRSRVRQLFDYSVRSLEQTQQLGDTAKILHLPEARQPLLEQREKIIADIQAGIQQLGGTLAALQRLGGTGTQSNRELSRLRDELDQSLQIASRVEDRLNSLLDQTEPDLRSQPSRLGGTNPQKGN